nr:MAG TPA: hypothetical protein [Caudoviricetes sp.]
MVTFLFVFIVNKQNSHILHQILKPYIVPNYVGFYLCLRTTHYYILCHGW